MKRYWVNLNGQYSDHYAPTQQSAINSAIRDFEAKHKACGLEMPTELRITTGVLAKPPVGVKTHNAQGVFA